MYGFSHSEKVVLAGGRGQEEGEGHFSGVEIFLQERNKKQYRRPCTVIKARLPENQVRSWVVHRMVEPGPLGTFPVLFFSSYAL